MFSQIKRLNSIVYRNSSHKHTKASCKCIAMQFNIIYYIVHCYKGHRFIIVNPCVQTHHMQKLVNS